MKYVAQAIPMWMVVKIVVFRLRRLDRGLWRFVSTHDVFRLACGNVIASGCGYVALTLFGTSGFSRSILLIDFLLCFLATCGIRVLTRMSTNFRPAGGPQGKRVLIYGAGSAGVRLLGELNLCHNLKYRVCGFIDDDARLQGRLLMGVPILGPGRDLSALSAKYQVEQVLIALPSASGPKMAEILRSCHEAAVQCRTIPAISEILENQRLTSQIRNVDVEDLLGRSTVNLAEDEIKEKLCNEVIMVTGAAGSIGAELCRQIARFRPRAIVAYEISETGLFHLENEMKASFADVKFIPEIGSIQNRQRLCEALARHRPSVVYHAAAYKHVPMMEAHITEAIENNVFGTYQVATASAEHGVRDFVMISSDKAVRPTNIMGATKRIAELVIRSLPSDKTKYVSVRFGNVLGSNGSVIPIFKKQIAEGGPVTVTHPDMRRYFMTIREAAQLVLQASTMGRGGEIFVLDMGQPVRVLNLAENLILLSGLRPNIDVPITFTGVRPGEKLYEELSGIDEHASATHHPKIKIFAGHCTPSNEMLAPLKTLRDLCASRNLSNLLLHMKDMVPDYNPSNHVLRSLLGVDSQPLTNSGTTGLQNLAAAIAQGNPAASNRPAFQDA